MNIKLIADILTIIINLVVMLMHLYAIANWRDMRKKNSISQRRYKFWVRLSLFSMGICIGLIIVAIYRMTVIGYGGGS